MNRLEDITIPIKVGSVLGGKFKNKRIVVKSMMVRMKKGDITINNKPLLKFRLFHKTEGGVTNTKKVSIVTIQKDFLKTTWFGRKEK